MMQRREQILLAGLLGAVVIWQMSGFVSSVVFGPFETRREDYQRLQKAVSQKNDTLMMLVKAKKSLADWKSRSLPPDDDKNTKQPTAYDAGRLYLQWLTDLAQLCDFESLKVTPGGQTPKGGIYISVIVKLDAEVRYDQLARFLDLFYRTQLLHRISKLNVSTKVFEGDPTLTVHLDAEGLVLMGTPPRKTLFPQTRLTEPLPEDATKLTVEPSKDFPAKGDFHVQIKNEILKVTATDAGTWTAQRGLEQTRAASYAPETSVELFRLDPSQSERTAAELRTLISTNLFTKPPPALKLKIAGLGEKTFTRGRPIDFVINATNYDVLLGRPEFTVVGTPPPGFILDRNGRVTWKPDESVTAGTYNIPFEIKHPSADNGHLTERLTIRLRDAKSAPKLSAAKPPRVYLNREWKFRPELEAGESNLENLSWKLGDRPPAGMTINAKTGEIAWTPGDAVPIGEMTVSLVVSDNETPPQSTNLSLKLEVQDDAAQFTRLTAFFAVGDKKRVFVTDQSTGKNTELREGDAIAISDLKGTIKLIDKKHVIVTVGTHDLHWDYGESLREAQAKIKDY